MASDQHGTGGSAHHFRGRFRRAADPGSADRHRRAFPRTVPIRLLGYVRRAHDHQSRPVLQRPARPGQKLLREDDRRARDRVRTQHHRPIRPAGRMEGHRAGHSRRAGRLPRQRQLSEPVRHARHVPPQIRGGQARVAPGGPGRQEKRHDGVGGGGEGTGPSIPVGQGHAVPDRPAHRLVRYRSDDVAGRGQTTVRLGLGGFHILAYPRLRALP